MSVLEHHPAAPCLMNRPELRVARRAAIVAAACAAAAAALQPPAAAADLVTLASANDVRRVPQVVADRLAADVAAMQTHRPGYPFWQHIFAIPDGSVAYGSREDGRLLVVFPAAADWTRAGRWHDPSLATVLEGRQLPTRAADRAEAVAELLGSVAGPVIHNGTRGRFLLPNVARYGPFLSEWGAIYERFGVPAEIGLAQAIVESGLNGTVRSEARAIGFCQWLEGNWNRLRRLSPHVIEAQNQTTQASYCAAYLTVLATKYGSFVPALSEHHAGGVNVGRTLVTGARLGGEEVRAQYFLGSAFAIALRGLPERGFADLYRTYGPRSFRYTELVFGNTTTAVELRASVPQTRIFATRARRDITLDEIVRRSGVPAAEVRRHNPALVRRVPAGANLYLPVPVNSLGDDVAFWHHPPDTAFTAALADFLVLQASPDQWDQPAFLRVLLEHQRRFERSRTEEGTVMAVVLAYVIDEARSSRRGQVLSEFRTSPRIARLFEEGFRAVGSAHSTPAPAAAPPAAIPPSPTPLTPTPPTPTPYTPIPPTPAPPAATPPAAALPAPLR
jgi:hypothetical protein